MRISTLSALQALFGFTLASQSFAAADGAGKTREPEVWANLGQWRQAATHLDDWQFVQANIDGFKFYIDQFNQGSRDELRQLGDALRKHNIKVGVECGGLLTMAPIDDTIGERTAEVELKKLSALTEAGIRLDVLHIDGAIRRVMNDPIHKGIEPFTSLDQAIDQLIVYMRLVRKEHPAVQFYHGSNFPNWGYKDDPAYTFIHNRPEGWGDYFPVFKALLKKTREAGIPFTGIMLDSPYDYTIGEVPMKRKGAPDPKATDWWARMLDMEAECRKEGVEYMVMFNSQRGGKESDKLFCDETLLFIDEYRRRGGDPDGYIVQSWYKHPQKITPETEPNSMTWLYAQTIERVKGVKPE